MVDFQRVDGPVCVCEGGGVVFDKGVARCGFGGAGAARPNVAGPIAAECGVKYDLLVLKGIGNVAGAHEYGCWCSPARWIRGAAGDVGWYGAAGEEVDRDGAGGPHGGVHAAVVAVESSAEAVGGALHDLAAGVCELAGSIDVAVGRGDGAGEATCVGNGAARTSVERHGIGSLFIDSFDDVDFATVWPVWANHPESWPSPTSGRHVGQVQDHQPSVIRFLAGESDAGPAVWRHVCVIHTHVDAAGCRD